MAVFKMDGVSYDVAVASLTRSFQVLDGDNTGRTLSGVMDRDVIGTYYNYSMEINTKSLSLEQYNAFYEVISSPKEFHDMVFPYGSSTLSFKAYCASGEDTLLILNGKNYWKGLKVIFTAKSPQRRPT